MPAPIGNQNAVGNIGGKPPSKYKKRYCQDIIDYFNKNPFEFVMKDDGTPVLNKFGEPVTTPTEFPTLEGFAFGIGVLVETLKAWTKEYVEFNLAWTRARGLQKKILIANGLNGGYNSNFSIFVGTNCFPDELKNSKDVKHTGDPEQPIVFEKKVTEMTQEEIDEYLKSKIGK